MERMGGRIWAAGLGRVEMALDDHMFRNGPLPCFNDLKADPGLESKLNSFD